MEHREQQKQSLEACKVGHETQGHFRKQIPAIVERIVDSCQDKGCFEHIHAEMIPSREAAISIVSQLRELLFPGYFNKSSLEKTPWDLRDKRLLTFSSDTLSRIELTAKGATIEVGKNNNNEWQILQPRPLRADGGSVEPPEASQVLMDTVRVLATAWVLQQTLEHPLASTVLASAKANDGAWRGRLDILHNP